MIEKVKIYIKLATILFVALLLSNLLVSDVFINKSPTIRPQIGTYLIAKIKKTLNPSEFIAYISSKIQQKKSLGEKEIPSTFSKLQEVAFTQIAPGVKARANENVSETSYELGKIKWIRHKVIIDGKEHEYGWPEGKELPSDASVKSMFR